MESYKDTLTRITNAGSFWLSLSTAGRARFRTEYEHHNRPFQCPILIFQSLVDDYGSRVMFMVTEGGHVDIRQLSDAELNTLVRIAALCQISLDIGGLGG